ncbi:MAG: hypothetical protein RL291_1915 [Pseudomonadota bacterium]
MTHTRSLSLAALVLALSFGPLAPSSFAQAPAPNAQADAKPKEQAPEPLPKTPEELLVLQQQLWVLDIGAAICQFEEGPVGEALGNLAVRVAVERNIEIDEVFGLSTPAGKKFVRDIDEETASAGEKAVCDRIWGEYGPKGSKRANLFSKAAP